MSALYMTRLSYNKINIFSFLLISVGHSIVRNVTTYAVFYIYLCNVHLQLVIPEYLLHLLFNILFIASGEWLALCLNLPLIAYHINRYGLFYHFTLTSILYSSYINFLDSPDIQLHSMSLCTT
jgi:Cornichon protein.